MLNIFIITPFPEMVKPIINQCMLKKAIDNNMVKIKVVNLFNYKNKASDRIDDYPFGGGEGMIIKAEPIYNALQSIDYKDAKIIFPSPDGKLFNQSLANDFSKEKNLIFICGHYKGIDQRIRDKYVTDEISIGDFVLTSGEIPAMLIVDSIVRLLPGVLNTIESAKKDSFSHELLDGPHYTRPREFNGMKVPNILLSGNHEDIKKWFLNERKNKTKKRRQDLWENYKLELEDNGE